MGLEEAGHLIMVIVCLDFYGKKRSIVEHHERSKTQRDVTV